jgi:protocatechuate 3,4-dioxygenase beta subunit
MQYRNTSTDKHGLAGRAKWLVLALALSLAAFVVLRGGLEPLSERLSEVLEQLTQREQPATRNRVSAEVPPARFHRAPGQRPDKFLAAADSSHVAGRTWDDGNPDGDSAGRSPSRSDDDPEPEAPDLVIAGSVLDQLGTPLPGIAVLARQMGGDAMLARTSDSVGMFRFESLAEGEYELAADAGPDYLPAQLRVRAGIETAELRLQRQRAVRIHGTVQDQRGKPLDQVKVRVLGAGPVVVSGPGGEYELAADLLKAGQPPVVQFQRERFRELRQRATDALVPGLDRVRLDVRMQPSDPSVTLTGAVTGPRGEPVAGARVWLSASSPRAYRRTASDDRGRYRFPEVEVGDNYQVGVEPADDYESYLSNSFPIGPDDTRHDVALAKLELATLHGTVTDPEGNALPGFSLWLRSMSASHQGAFPIRTDRDGRFVAEDIPAGLLRLESRSQPRLEATGIRVYPGQVAQARIAMDWGPHWLLGRVVDGAGRPVSQARIVMQWSQQSLDVSSRSWRETRSDPQGYFSFSNLGAGVHELAVEAAGYASARLQKDPARNREEFAIKLSGGATASSGGP